MNENENKEAKDSRVGVLNKHSLDLFLLVDKNKAMKRDVLNGIHVTGEFTEVTNGHYAMRISNNHMHHDDYPNGPNGEKISDKKEVDIVVPVEVAKKLQKNLPKMKSLPMMENAVFGENTKEDNSNVEIITYDLEAWNPVNFKPIEDKFPDMDAVIPKKQAEIEIGFNPDYMIKLCQQFKKNGVDTVKLSIHSPTEVMVLDGWNSRTDQEIKALLMPKKV